MRHFHAACPKDQEYLESLHFKLPHLGTGDVIRQGQLSCVERPAFKSPAVPVIFELFSGTGRVTACLRRIGLKQSHAVDHLVVEDCATPPLIADLSTKEGQDLTKLWLGNPLLAAVYAAPVCGTCSRAREIPVRDANGIIIPGPKPVRDALFPDGLPTLSGSDQRRVDIANRLYDFLSDVAVICHTRDILIIIESPHRSWYWSTKAFLRIQHILPHRVSFDNCAYGGLRPKRTTLASSHQCLDTLAKNCAGPSCARSHAEWGPTDSGFATKSESAYPPLLAGGIASCIARHLIKAGWHPPSSWPGPQSFLTACRAVSGAQPKASKFPALVPEHIASHPCAPTQRLSAPWPVPNDCACSVSVIPNNSQLLRAIPLSVNVGTSARTSAPAYQHAAVSEQAWGVPFSPNEFKQAACNAGHPKLLKTPLPQHLQHAIDLNKKMNPNELLEFRERWFQKWEARAKQLEPQEDDLKQSLPEHLREILKSKRLLLWKELLHDIEYEDQGVFDEVVSGTDLMGQVPLTGIFHKRLSQRLQPRKW